MKRKCIEILNNIFGAENWNFDDLYSSDEPVRYVYDDSSGYFITFKKHIEDVYYELFYNGKHIETGTWD